MVLSLNHHLGMHTSLWSTDQCDTHTPVVSSVVNQWTMLLCRRFGHALVCGPGWYAWQHLELPAPVMSGAAGMRSQVPRRVCEECVRVDSV